MRPVTLLAYGLVALALTACDAPQEARKNPKADQQGKTAQNPGPSAAAATVNAWAAASKARAERAAPADSWRWLEDITGTRALLWVVEHNRKTRQTLGKDSRFDSLRDEALALLTAPDRIPYGGYRNGYVYNFWQDENHVRGVWRRATLESYRTDSPEWDVLLDMDRLAASEGVNWVLDGINCLPPDDVRCMIALSRGGRDRTVLREWSLADREFVENGFQIASSYSSVDWLDRDTLLVVSDRQRSRLGSMLFGYRHNVRKWKRGTPLHAAEVIFTGERSDLGMTPVVMRRPEGKVILVVRKPGIYDTVYAVLKEDGSLVELPMPRHANLRAMFKGQMLFILREAWTLHGEGGKGRKIPQGALVAFDLDRFLKTGKRPAIRTIFAPGERSTIVQVDTARDRVLLGLLNNISSELFTLGYENGEWRKAPVAIPKEGTASLAAGPYSNVAFLAFENYLTPDSLYQLDPLTGELTQLKSLPPRFDAGGLTVERFEAVSEDGTKVPYTLVRPANAPRDGNLPVLLYGYGGFGVSMTPRYWAEMGKLWMEKGGGFAVANIRGGGEFGPDWHQAALKRNRPRGFEDFIAVAEDMIARKITSPRRLGIMGGSNGGLLVGVAFTQRPELFNAVVCEVPLLDMIRYPELGPGRIWLDEYGDPSVAGDRKVLMDYSPYHNVREDADYPRVFFLTSSDDDRVHPGHARKMAARMEAQGHDLFYYEYFEGGHSARASIYQRADIMAMQFTYLARMLMDGEGAAEGAGEAGAAVDATASQ